MSGILGGGNTVDLSDVINNIPRLQNPYSRDLTYLRDKRPYPSPKKSTSTRVVFMIWFLLTFVLSLPQFSLIFGMDFMDVQTWRGFWPLFLIVMGMTSVWTGPIIHVAFRLRAGEPPNRALVIVLKIMIIILILPVLIIVFCSDSNSNSYKGHNDHDLFGDLIDL